MTSKQKICVLNLKLFVKVANKSSANSYFRSWVVSLSENKLLST